MAAGDTGSDCVGTSNRQGAKSLRNYDCQQPPKATLHHNAWPYFPMLLKTTSSHEEGVERHWGMSTKEFIGDENGNLKALRVAEVQWVIGEDGRRSHFEEVPGSEGEIPCDLALLAMGYVHPQHEGLIDKLGVEKDTRGNVKATEKNYQTSIPKVFAAGECAGAKALVVWAISEGRECARKVDEFLMNRPSLLESKDDNLAERVWL